MYVHKITNLFEDCLILQYNAMDIENCFNFSWQQQVLQCDNYKVKECQSTKLTALHANIRSIEAYFEEFESFLGSSNLEPNIIAFTETWLKNDSQTIMYYLPARDAGATEVASVYY